jgi:hypothetical protein
VISAPVIPELMYGVMEWEKFAVGDYMPSEKALGKRAVPQLRVSLA